MPLARVRKVGEDDLVLGGNLILDLPKIGWLQGGYDSFYGASAGIGFNLNKRISIGYTMEKGLTDTFDNFGVTHEISFAYSFTPNLTEDRVMLEDGYEESLVSNEQETPQALTMTEKDQEIAELRKRLAENDAILAELMFRQDSMEQNRQQDLEKRFEMVMRMVRQETGGERPDVEEKAKKLYFINNDQDALAQQDLLKEAPEVPAEVTEAPEIAEPEVQKKDAVAAAEYTQPRVTEVARDRTRTEGNRATDIKHRKFRDLQDVADGYYVVANVYKGSHYLNKFMDDLRARGIEASYIENPNNGLKYVYLKRFDSWGGAEKAVRSGLGGDYEGSLWVMDVDNRYTNEAYAANAEKVRDRASRYENNVLRKNVVVRDQVTRAERQDDILAETGGGTRYFLIANVFSNKKYADRFVRYLNSKGLNASYFINPENNYRYVYLKRHDNWNSALISYYSKLNDSYEEKMWIMRVKPNQIA
jgi:hypothetical protein